LDWSINENDGTNIFADDAAWHVNDATAPKDYSALSDPSSLNTVDAHYDASKPANLETDVGIDKWINSKLPGTADLEQAASGSQPSTGNAIGPNSLNALRFVEGTPDDQLEVITGAITRIQTLEVWLAFRFDDPSTGTTQYIADSETGGDRVQIAIGSTGIPAINAGTNISGGSIPDDDLPHIFRCLFKGTLSEIWLDGVLVEGPSDAGANGMKTLSVGANNLIAIGMTGEIGEVIISNRELPSREVTFLENYLERWTTVAPTGGSGSALASSIGIGI